jgi:hypothetical protein
MSATASFPLLCRRLPSRGEDLDRGRPLLLPLLPLLWLLLGRGDELRLLVAVLLLLVLREVSLLE